MTTRTTVVGATTTSRSEGEEGGQTALLTGFPALRARAVLEALLAEQVRLKVVAIVHEERFAEAEARLQELGEERALRVELRRGDPVAMDFGLGGPEYLELAARVQVVHAAYSVLDPSVNGDVCEAINIGAAREVIELARAARTPPRVVWYSSLFVSGNRRGRVFERELEAGQAFRNRAEKSLAIAERMLRQSEIPLTVLRAGHLVGAAPGGEVETLTGGPYPLVALLASAPAELPIPLPPGADAPLPLTPVDYLGAFGAYVGRRVSSTTPSRGAGIATSLHVFDGERLTLGRFLELVAQRTGRSIEPSFNPSTLTRVLLGNPFSKLLPQSARGILDVLTTAAEYDQTHVGELIARGAPSGPPLESVLSALVDHVRKRIEDGALGRERPARGPWLVA